jgi:hypothetical protein
VKRFAYTSFGLLCLAAAYNIGAQHARAEWNAAPAGRVVGGHGNFWYNTEGQAWNCQVSSGFVRWPEQDLPVPVAEVRFMDAGYLVTTSDDVWEFGDGWQLIGTFPESPVTVRSDTWGAIKSVAGR